MRRYAVIIVVGGLHVLVLYMMLVTRREHPVELEVPITMAIYIPPPDVVPPPAPRIRGPKAIVPAPVTVPAPPEIPPPTVPTEPAAEAGKSVDWMAEGQKEAAIVAARGGLNSALNAAKPQTPPSQPTQHHAGEQYSLSTGEKIFWTSDSCYLISDPPDPSTPNTFAHFAQSRVTCPGKPKPPDGELFHQSAAYRQHHPED